MAMKKYLMAIKSIMWCVPHNLSCAGPFSPRRTRENLASMAARGALLMAVAALCVGSAVGTLSFFLEIFYLTSYPFSFFLSIALGNCDPIAPEYCLFPYPNNFFAEADPSTETGLRLRLNSDMLPIDTKNGTIDPVNWNTLDGFSPMPSIMTFFGNVSLDNVPGHRVRQILHIIFV